MKRIVLSCFFIALIPFIFYLYCLCPGVSWEDSGEFITTAASLGIAHPPGHPLYIVIAHLFTIGGTPQTVARSVNLFSALSASLALFIFSVLLALLSGPSLKQRTALYSFLALLSVTTCFALSDTFWRFAEIAEVYSLHAFLTLSLLASLVLISKHGGRFVLLFSYVLGISLTNNVTIAYLIPAFLCFLILERSRMEKRLIIPSVALFLLGISLYGFIPLRARFDPVFNWGNASSMKHFLHLLTAREFSRGFMNLAYTETSLFPTLLQLLRETSFWGIIPLFFGLFTLFKKKRNLAVLFVIAIASNTVFSLLTGRGPDLHAYFLPSIVVFFLLIGYGCLHAMDRLRTRAWTMLPLLLALSLVPAFLHYRGNCARNDTDAPSYGRALLERLPERAVLLTENTNDYFILTYLSEVESTGRGEIFYAPLFKEPWYREMLLSAGFRWEEPLTPLALARASSREVFYTPGAGISLPVENLSPYGPLFRIVMHKEPLKGNDFSLPKPVRAQGKKRYAYLFARFGEFYFGRGAYATAITAFEQARAYDPSNGAICHNLALLYRKLNDLPKSAYYEKEAKRLGFKK